MGERLTRAVVHLELHTDDQPRACAFYSELCGWRAERVETAAGSYLALDVGGRIGGGVVECDTRHPLWLPYVEVEEIGEATASARGLGGAVVLGPREGPAGWRSVVVAPAGGAIALWQPKR
jgi:predicted enzyme related to lactoylglutathione lyase